MKATLKNLLHLERLLSLYDGEPIPAYALRRKERYHLDRLVNTGHLRRRIGSYGMAEYYHDDTCASADFPFAGMHNKRMQEQLVAGDAIDVSGCPQTAHGEYLLEEFIAGKDYCDAKTEQWIWSIGRHRETGRIYASHSSNKYQNPAFECLWLR